MTTASQSVSTRFQDSIKLAELEALFALKSTQADSASFFLSKPWLLNWLAVIKSPVSVAVFYKDDLIIGFALIGKQSNWYGDTYYLNQTGNAPEDQMWIEHNDIICAKQHKRGCRESLISALQQRPKFHRFILSMVSDQHWPLLEVFTWSVESSPVAYVDLSELQTKQINYETTLSKNSKSAVRRAAKYIEKQYGEITMRIRHDNLHELLQQELAPLHIKQWQNTEHGSGFENPVFTKFLALLSKSNAPECRCEVLSFHAGDKTLGYLFNIISHNEVYFYLSAINYADADNKYKPGMVIHKLAIEHYARLNYSKYDFLAGAARYKESLSTDTYTMYTIELAKNSWMHRLLFKVNRLLQLLKHHTHR